MERSLVLSQLGVGRGHGPLLSPLSLSAARLHFHPSSSSLKMQNQMHPMASTVSVASRARYQAVEATTSAEASELADINWDNLGFEPVPTDYMYIAKCSQNGTFSKGELQRFGPIELSPSSGVLNYGQEGLAAINLIVENDFHRATRGGTGGIKTIGNYASVLKAQSIAQAKGYSDVLYLDSVSKKYLEEVSSCNVFVVKDKVISTPAIKGTILPGITRKSIIDVARTQGYQVEERLVSVDELFGADEVFCTGTAVVVSPVGSITYLEERVEYRNKGVGMVSQQLYSALTNLQMGLSEDKMGWTMELT